MPTRDPEVQSFQYSVSADTAQPRALVVARAPAHAALYYDQHGNRFGHTDATAAYRIVGAARPRGMGSDLTAIDKALVGLPPGSAVVAALPRGAGGDRLAQQLRTLATRQPQVRFERHAIRIDRDKTLHAPGRHARPTSLSLTVAAGRDR